MKITVTYRDLINELKPSLELVSKKQYPSTTDLDHLLNIADNLREVSDKAKLFWETREKILNDLADKDENGNAIQKQDENGNSYLSLTDESKELFGKRLTELNDKKVKIEIKKLKKTDFKGVDNLTPSELFGLALILE